MMVPELVDERDDRPGERGVFGGQHPQRQPRVPLCPLLLELAGPAVVVILAGNIGQNGNGDHVLADRERLGDRVLGKPGHFPHRDQDDRRLGGWLAGTAPRPRARPARW